MTGARHQVMAGLWERVIALVDKLDDDDWQRRVPWTPLWTVADLVAHLSGLQSALNGAPQPQPPAERADWALPDDASRFDVDMAPAVAARRDWTPKQRLEELQTAARAHTASMAEVSDWDSPAEGPAGPTTQEGLFQIRAFDVWVHLQDLHQALGRDVEAADVSPEVGPAAQWVLRYVPWMFVKRAGAKESATMRLTLTEPLPFDDVLEVRDGRAGWNPQADPGDCLVRATPAGLTLLACGRGDPPRWRAEGALAWAGARGEDFVDQARLF